MSSICTMMVLPSNHHNSFFLFFFWDLQVQKILQSQKCRETTLDSAQHQLKTVIPENPNKNKKLPSMKNNNTEELSKRFRELEHSFFKKTFLYFTCSTSFFLTNERMKRYLQPPKLYYNYLDGSITTSLLPRFFFILQIFLLQYLDIFLFEKVMIILKRFQNLSLILGLVQ